MSTTGQRHWSTATTKEQNKQWLDKGGIYPTVKHLWKKQLSRLDITLKKTETDRIDSMKSREAILEDMEEYTLHENQSKRLNTT